MPYNHQEIEKKWQQKWGKDEVFKSQETSNKSKFYALDMFPYPSGAGLHVGHPKGYIATDVLARYKMMCGFNVLHPMGWDAFGLPAENYAIKNKVHPSVATAQNVETFKRQLSILGFTYDWSREVNTTDPKYYKWTQWAFLQMFKKGLAYESYEPINWCPTCQTGLANEDLDGDKCERCGTPVEQKPMRQWVLKITDYADRLLADLNKLPEWPESIKQMQREWIGRSEGALVKFKISDKKNNSDPTAYRLPSTSLEVFTTRPDTLFGATYMVLAPEHPLVSQITTDDQRAEVEAYVAAAKNKTAIERGDDTKEKTGVFTGTYAINPVNDEEIPVWVADYVLWGYGTGAIMAVPAHDERDHAFAKKFDLPIKQVVAPHFIDPANPPHDDQPKTKPRKVVHVILRRPGDNKTLLLNWHTNLTASRTHLHTFVIGGIEDGEDLAIAGARELQEETGYKNFKFVRELGLEVRTEYFAAHKGENRLAEIRVAVFDLINEDRDEIAAEELKNFSCEWVDDKDVEKTINVIDAPIICEWYRSGGKAYVGEGELINSDFLNGLATIEAKTKIISWLKENGLGQRKIQYKLRDWVFSRQRYWGEPIPLVHCEACKNREYKYLLLHGRTGNSQKNFFPWLKRELENRGHEVFCPDLPNTTDPKVVEQAEFVLKNFSLDENTIIIGHSLGGAVALKFLELSNKFVARVVLVDSLIRPEFNDRRRDDLEKNFDWQFDFTKIKNLSGEFIDLADKDFPVITQQQFLDKARLLGTRLIYSKAQDEHFCGVEEPEILRFALNDGVIPISESELPLELPQIEHYEPSGTGESPLATIDKWVNTKCPVCGSPAKRETNTMPQWAGSCWYYLRYCNPQNDQNFFSSQGFCFRPAIQPTEMDKKYFSEFQKIYTNLKNKKIKVWAGNRFLLNGLNGAFWLPFRTISLMVWEKDRVEIGSYLDDLGYKLTEAHSTNYLFEKDSVRVELVAMFEENGKIFSRSYQGANQEMTAADLLEDELGSLWGFNYRIVSPAYNLSHYKFVRDNEAEDRKGLGDDEKISFLESWAKGIDEKIRYWSPVDLYVGGAEHATRHLIYARFWHKFLYDLGVVSGDEPFMRLQNVGLILAEDGRKMSKRWGNVINPDDVVAEYGADAMRVYEMFMGPFNQPAAWSTNGLVGTRRFLEKVVAVSEMVVDQESREVTRGLHQTIKKVSDDFEAFRFNTAIAQLMTFINSVHEAKGLTKETFVAFLKLLCPLAPHLSNELFEVVGGQGFVENQPWPEFDAELAKADFLTIAVQVNGKLRGTLEVLPDATEIEIRNLAVVEENVKKYLTGEIVKAIFVSGKLINLVVK